MTEPQQLNAGHAAADRFWRQARRGPLWSLFMLLAFTTAFSIGAAKRLWDKFRLDERIHQTGMATQPGLARPLELEARNRHFESTLYLAGAAVTACLSFYAYRRFVRLRRDFRLAVGRCIRCGYTLDGLGEPRCPECGAPFNAAQLDPTARRPPPGNRRA
jgi:hypothetical protein